MAVVGVDMSGKKKSYSILLSWNLAISPSTRKIQDKASALIPK